MLNQQLNQPLKSTVKSTIKSTVKVTIKSTVKSTVVVKSDHQIAGVLLHCIEEKKRYVLILKECVVYGAVHKRRRTFLGGEGV